MVKNDAHPEDLKSALRKRFGSLAKFERQYRLPTLAAKAAIRRPHRRAEQAIADALGRSPVSIWPSRYRPDGTRLSPQPASNYAPARGAQ